MTPNTEDTVRPPSNHRARWAAIGAAVAVSLGAGGIGIARATSPEGASAYVAITPCRIVDTRSDPTFHIGPHNTLNPNAKITIDGWGAQGQCTSPALPSNTTGLQLNVTALGATLPTFLTFFPGAGDPPNSSSLNPTPGEPPVPNAVTTQLDGAGKFSVYNLQGTVDMVVDVVGYYIDHDHDDRYGPSLPDAMANLNGDGSIRSGGDNIASITYNAGLNRYEITFTDLEFNINEDVAVVSAREAGQIATYSSVGGSTFLVSVRDHANNPVQGPFSFVIWDNV